MTPYPNLEQIVSGTMSYAMGAGRAIVSTPYAYASELLADGRGVLVPAAAPVALSAALNALLEDPALRAMIGSRACVSRSLRDRCRTEGRDAADDPAGGRRCLTAHPSTP